jgi:predicted NBD/HSP70 family sugar kinase
MFPSPVILGLDFGGTKIAAAVCSLDGTRLGSATVGSGGELGARASFGRGVQAARDLLGTAAPGATLAAVGVSTFGIPFEDRVDLAPAISGWGDLPLGRELRAAFPGAAIRMATDAKAAAQAEVRWGALADCDPAIYLNLGTGLSTALVIGGQVVAGADGAAGEIGYNLRALADVGLPFGARVVLEDMISGQALARRAPEPMGAADVFGAAASEPGLDRLVTEFVTELAFHVVNLAISVNPARIAVGGGLVRSWERLRPGLEEALKAGTPFPPELVPARFPDDAPLIGAVALAADAAGADISLDDLAPHAGNDPRPGPSRIADNAPHADNVRTDTARADGAADGAPVTQHSHPQTERLQS